MSTRRICLYFNKFDSRPTLVESCLDMKQNQVVQDVIPAVDQNDYIDLKVDFEEPTYYYPYLVSFLTNDLPNKTLHIDFGNWIADNRGIKYSNIKTLDNAMHKHFNLFVDIIKTITASHPDKMVALVRNFRIEIMSRNLIEPDEEYQRKWRNQIYELIELFPMQAALFLNFIHSIETDCLEDICYVNRWDIKLSTLQEQIVINPKTIPHIWDVDLVIS